MAVSINMGSLMCIMAVSVTNCAWMVSTQFWVLPRFRVMLGILCRGVGSIIVQSVGLLATSLRLVVTLIHTSSSSSLPLLVIRGGLIREVAMCVDLSRGSRRS